MFFVQLELNPWKINKKQILKCLVNPVGLMEIERDLTKNISNERTRFESGFEWSRSSQAREHHKRRCFGAALPVFS